MEFRRVRILQSVAELRSIGRAARALGIAQPALSRQLKSLETDVQAVLLERGARGVSLTPAGRAFIEGTAGLDERLSESVHRARLTALGRLGRLRISLGRIAVDDERVGRALEAARAAEPGIELVVDEVGSPLHTRALLRRETDLVIGSEESPHHRRLSRRALDTETIRAGAIPASHPLSRHDVLEPEALRDLPLLLAGGGRTGWVFPAVRAALRSLGFPQPIEHESLETVYALIAAGRGWMPTSGWYESRPPIGTAVRRVRGFSVEVPLLMRWRRGDDSAVLGRVSRLVHRAFRSPSGEEHPPQPGAPLEGSRPVNAAAGATLEARHLRALIAIANDGSVADAARRLDITQSAVSRQLAAVERIVGATLFIRTRAGAHATAAGEVLREGAAAALAKFDGAAWRARLAARGIERRCVVGIDPSPIASDALTTVLRRAPAELPAIAIEVVEMTSARLRDALQQGRIDVALLMRSDGQSPHESFEWRFIAHDPYDTALVPADGLGTSTTAVGVRELGELTCVVLSRDEDPGYHDEVVALLRKAGIASALLPLQHGPRALWRYVASGARWTLAPRSMRAAPPANLVALPLEGISLGASLNVAVRVGETDPHVRALAAAF